MNEEKIKELFEKSQEILNMMDKFGIKEYHGYYILESVVGNFLVLHGIPITPSLSDSYFGNDLNKFTPKTSIEIMEKFMDDIENKLFLELENFYSLFIKKC
jgi:hypothetical protein